MRSCWIALGALLGAPEGCDVGWGGGGKPKERGDTYTQIAGFILLYSRNKKTLLRNCTSISQQKVKVSKDKQFVCPSFIVGYSSLSLYSLQKDNILTKIWNLVTWACPEIIVVSCLY